MTQALVTNTQDLDMDMDAWTWIWTLDALTLVWPGPSNISRFGFAREGDADMRRGMNSNKSRKRKAGLHVALFPFN